MRPYCKYEFQNKRNIADNQCVTRYLVSDSEIDFWAAAY